MNRQTDRQTNRQTDRQSENKWDGEAGAVVLKDVRLEGTAERTDRVRLPDAAGQGTTPERGGKSKGSLVMSLCFTVLESRDSKK